MSFTSDNPPTSSNPRLSSTFSDLASECSGVGQSDMNTGISAKTLNVLPTSNPQLSSILNDLTDISSKAEHSGTSEKTLHVLPTSNP